MHFKIAKMTGFMLYIFYNFLKKHYEDFPDCTVVKNPPANAGDRGSNPGPGRSHMPWSN